MTHSILGTKKVLIVEDETSLREVLKDNLMGAGFAVIEARNGHEGFEKAVAEHPDIILLDILLPGIDGMEIMKKLRKDAWGKRVPIILITNLSANQKILQGVMEGKPVFYLEKSGWHVRDIVEKVRLAAFYAPLLKRQLPA